VTFSSDEIWGTTFAVVIPRVAPPSRDAGTRVPEEDLDHDVALAGLRVLLAEDSPDSQRLIVHLLEQGGAEVTVFGNGKAAVEAWLTERDQGRPFDVILLDIQMPVMDGYEAAGLLRNEGCTGPIIALTAHDMAGARRRCIAAGCDAFASKPIDRATLIGTISSVTRTAGASGC